MASKIKTNDHVIVLTGKSKGKAGRVLRVLHAKKSVIVEGINLIKKCVRGNPNTQQQGGIVEKEAPIHMSNVALVNPQTKKGDKVKFKVLEDGSKVRCYKSTGELVE